MDENNDKASYHRVPGIYQPRHPENTVLHQIFQDHLETWITQIQENAGFVPSHVEKDFREYLKCGLLCHGFARLRCTCGHEFLVAFSCKGHGICPSCNARRRLKRRLTWLTMFSLKYLFVNGSCHCPSGYAIFCITTPK